MREGGNEASAVFHFNRSGQIVKMCSPASGVSRGAGSLAGSAPRNATPSIWYYRCERQAGFYRGLPQGCKWKGLGGGAGRPPRLCVPTCLPCCRRRCRQYKQCCGMMVPTELEAAWQLAGSEFSYAHIDVEHLSAWESLEMVHTANI